MGETVSSQLVMPKSRRWARAWLERPARVSKPAPQKSQRIRLKVPGSKLATVERERGTWTAWAGGLGAGVTLHPPLSPRPGLLPQRITRPVRVLTLDACLALCCTWLLLHLLTSGSLLFMASTVSLHTAQSIRDLTPRNTSPGWICSHLDEPLSSRAHVCITPVLSMKPWLNEAMDQWVGCLPLGICSDPLDRVGDLLWASPHPSPSCPHHSPGHLSL